MKVKFSKDFIKIYKKLNVRIRNEINKKIETFEVNSNEIGLRNHPLHSEWEGFRSIDITNDYRAIYQEVSAGGEVAAYFVDLGTHEELYR